MQLISSFDPFSVTNPGTLGSALFPYPLTLVFFFGGSASPPVPPPPSMFFLPRLLSLYRFVPFDFFPSFSDGVAAFAWYLFHHNPAFYGVSHYSVVCFSSFFSSPSCFLCTCIPCSVLEGAPPLPSNFSSYFLSALIMPLPGPGLLHWLLSS